MKKKLMTLTIIVTLAAWSVQVYAANVLNTNLIDLIIGGFDSIKSYYSTVVDNDTTDLDEQFKNESAQYVNDKTEEILDELEIHKNNEITRTEQELNAYLESLKEELNTIYNGQVEDIKDDITDQTNDSIENIKQNITKELEKQIKEKLKGK